MKKIRKVYSITDKEARGSFRIPIAPPEKVFTSKKNRKPKHKKQQEEY